MTLHAPDALIWETLFPDPTARRDWMNAFAPDSRPGDAVAYAFHFADAQTAAEWHVLAINGLGAAQAAFLHRHHVPPDYPTITKAFSDASFEDVLALRTHPNGYTTPAQAHLRALLLLTHPHLTADQRTLLVRCGATLTEITDLLATGTLNEDALALLGGLR